MRLVGFLAVVAIGVGGYFVWNSVSQGRVYGGELDFAEYCANGAPEEGGTFVSLGHFLDDTPTGLSWENNKMKIKIEDAARTVKIRIDLAMSGRNSIKEPPMNYEPETLRFVTASGQTVASTWASDDPDDVDIISVPLEFAYRPKTSGSGCAITLVRFDLPGAMELPEIGEAL